jgi:hypothetical protein
LTKREGVLILETVLRQEDIMTDYQYKSVIKMVADMVYESDDVKKAVVKLEELLPFDERKYTLKLSKENKE